MQNITCDSLEGINDVLKTTNLSVMLCITFQQKCVYSFMSCFTAV